MPDRKNINLTGQQLTIMSAGEEPPTTGWAFRVDRAVFQDGLQVGTDGALPTNHAHISYVPI
jgi:hypothetical protein